MKRGADEAQLNGQTPPSKVISQRGRRLVDSPVIPYIEGVIDSFVNPYNLETGKGTFGLAVAENKLSYDILDPRVKEAFASTPTSTFGYGIMHGRDYLRESIARLMREKFCKDPACAGPTADELLCVSGAGAVLTHLFYCLCEVGDVVLIPAPYYSAFDFDLSAQAEVKISQVDLTPADGYALSPALLDKAAKKAKEEKGRFPKVLLVTNPHNPLGRIMSRREMQEVIDWCEANDVHLVCDEIYALSCFGQYLPEGSLPTEEFVSLGQLLKGKLGSNKHVVWALSKDFGASGWRAGVLWTQNQDLQKAISNIASFTAISGPLQSVISQVFDDAKFIDSYLEENSRRLASSCAMVMRTLTELRIPFLQPGAGMFIWMDFRSLLPAVSPANPSSAEAEDLLYKALWKESSLVITPGLAQHASEPGWFRICFAALSPAVLEKALENLKAWVESHRN
eukprot:CAMPEP_0178407242 /NCGR_PEP_ID=MMETSP0689_2-20121128/19329_1 /TAXON_ID=160604 /ORGANISM="Amphidinium massartii, Strain CS-259" /LENGTH=452 /DNA_ID=CAMNT_0020028313 /DNA_START=114 /DNA_END=1472 /DNA_ORIENTATION=+